MSEHDTAEENHRLFIGPDIAQRELAVDEQPHDQRVETRPPPTLRSREDARRRCPPWMMTASAAPTRPCGSHQYRQPVIAVAFAPALPPAVQIDKQHQRAADQQSGPEAGDEEFPIDTSAATPYRIIGIDGVSRHRARHYLPAEPPPGSWIAVLDQRGDQDRADRECRRTDEPEPRRRSCSEHAGHRQAACTPPTSDLAKSTSRREMPPVSIRLRRG